MRHRLLISARSILLGWAALFGITYLVERPLLLLSAQFLGASWVPTVQLALECAGLAAVGWLIGRWAHLSFLFPAGMLTGLVLGIVLILYRYGKA